MREDRRTRNARLQPLAEALAKANNFTLPYYSKDSQHYEELYYVGPFLLVKWCDDPTDRDDGYGCRRIGSSEWCGSAEQAVEQARENLRYTGWYNMSVFDVERGEKCELEFGIRMKYMAVAELTAVAGEGCFDDAPSLGGERRHT